MTRIQIIGDHPAEQWFSMDRYAKELASALKTYYAPEAIDLIFPPDPWRNRYTRQLSRFFQYPQWAKTLPGPFYHIIDHSYGTLLRTLPLDRTVVTIHDIAPLYCKRAIPGLSTWLWIATWQQVKQAKFVLCDSEFIRDQIQPLMKPDCTLGVAQLGVDPYFKVNPAQREAVRTRYEMHGQINLLHVGSTHSRKNVQAILDTVAILRRDLNMSAVFWQIGGDPTPFQERKISDPDLFESIRFLGKVSDEALVGFYNAADLFIFPSLYEGFGLPVIEAMACGCPVIASNRASLPEVVGDAGLLTDPTDPQDIVNQAMILLQDREARRPLIERGLERASQFSWANTARQTAEFYEREMGV